MTREEIKNFLVREFKTLKRISKCQLTLKYKFPKIFESILEETIYLRNPSFNQRLYDILNEFYKIPKCRECGKEVSFESLFRGYRSFCSPGCVSRNSEVWKKTRKTWQEKYGVSHPLKCGEIKEKEENTKLKRYGTRYVSQLETNKEKIRQTSLNRYGTENPSQYPEIKEKMKASWRRKFIPYLEKMLDYLDLQLIDVYGNCYSKLRFKCLKCGTVFTRMWNEIQQGYRCPICFPKPKNYSKGEKEVLNFIREILKDDIIENSKEIINPYELDIYIPNKKVAIEFDGLYWHSEENGIDKKYHLNKTIECQKKEIYLIHIFEDEWIFKQNIVKARIKQILGVSDSKRIHARKCEIKEISSETKNKFLDEFHLQGKDSSIVKVGAFYKDQLISVMTFSKPNLSKGQRKKENGTLELNRFCSDYNYHIPGVASKLLEYFKRNYEWKEIFSYADRRWSYGNLYYRLGFEFDSFTKPNYWYYNGTKRIHRFNLRKRPNEPKDIPEWVLRTGEGYSRIWDCGNLKFKISKKGMKND